MKNYIDIEDFTSTEDVKIAVLKKYKMVGIKENKELSALYRFIQKNRDKDIIIVKGDAEMYHYWMKYCYLYSIKKMLEILTSKKADSICSKLIQILRKEDAKGRTRLVTYSDRTHSLIRKYL